MRIVERFAADQGLALDEARFRGRFGRGIASLGGARADVALLAPDTWMNRSGEAVAEALDGLGLRGEPERLIVVLDDADLPFGRIRIRPRGSSGGHNGLRSVIDRVGGSDFARLRFGIGRPDADPLADAAAPRGSAPRDSEPDAARDTADWVLDRFSPDEERALQRRVPDAAAALAAMLADGVPAAMSRYNRDPAAESASR